MSWLIVPSIHHRKPWYQPTSLATETWCCLEWPRRRGWCKQEQISGTHKLLTVLVQNPCSEKSAWIVGHHRRGVCSQKSYIDVYSKQTSSTFGRSSSPSLSYMYQVTPKRMLWKCIPFQIWRFLLVSIFRFFLGGSYIKSSVCYLPVAALQTD